jgi:hypothetical protein
MHAFAGDMISSTESVLQLGPPPFRAGWELASCLASSPRNHGSGHCVWHPSPSSQDIPARAARHSTQLSVTVLENPVQLSLSKKQLAVCGCGVGRGRGVGVARGDTVAVAVAVAVGVTVDVTVGVAVGVCVAVAVAVGVDVGVNVGVGVGDPSWQLSGAT